MIKKIVGFLLVISLVLCGCSILNRNVSDEVKDVNETNEPENSSVPVTLDMICYEYSDDSKELWQEIKADFESQNEDVTLNIMVFPWGDANIELESRLINEESIDIVTTDNVLGLYERELLVPTSSYASEGIKNGVLYDIDSQYGLPVAADVYGLYIKKNVAETGGLSEASVNSAGWNAILHVPEHFAELNIPYDFYVDVNDNALLLSKAALHRSTGETEEVHGISDSIINSVADNKELRHITAYDGVVEVLNGKIGIAIAPGSIMHILPEDLPMDDLLFLPLPGDQYVLYDSFSVFKKNGANEEKRLSACQRFFEYFYGDFYERFLKKEGYIRAINNN